MIKIYRIALIALCLGSVVFGADDTFFECSKFEIVPNLTQLDNICMGLKEDPTKCACNFIRQANYCQAVLNYPMEILYSAIAANLYPRGFRLVNHDYHTSFSRASQDEPRDEEDKRMSALLMNESLYSRVGKNVDYFKRTHQAIQQYFAKTYVSDTQPAEPMFRERDPQLRAMIEQTCKEAAQRFNQLQVAIDRYGRSIGSSLISWKIVSSHNALFKAYVLSHYCSFFNQNSRRLVIN